MSIHCWDCMCHRLLSFNCTKNIKSKQILDKSNTNNFRRCVTHHTADCTIVSLPVYATDWYRSKWFFPFCLMYFASISVPLSDFSKHIMAYGKVDAAQSAQCVSVELNEEETDQTAKHKSNYYYFLFHITSHQSFVSWVSERVCVVHCAIPVI